MNAIKDSIKPGRTVVGTGGAPNVDVSILADAGYDFLLFDTQHSVGLSCTVACSPPVIRQVCRR
jgi:2-keto-3-deoxy-L-rhamnonate aldolase RhmA